MERRMKLIRSGSFDTTMKRINCWKKEFGDSCCRDGLGGREREKERKERVWHNEKERERRRRRKGKIECATLWKREKERNRKEQRARKRKREEHVDRNRVEELEREREEEREKTEKATIVRLQHIHWSRFYNLYFKSKRFRRSLASSVCYYCQYFELNL